MDARKSEVEISKMVAETIKLVAETSKLAAEGAKCRRETFFYPFIAGAASLAAMFGAALAIVKGVIYLLS